MERRVKVSSKPLKLIPVTSQALKRIDHDDVAKALGAERVEGGLPKSLTPDLETRRNGTSPPDQ